jgi:hypothetical protein
MIAAHRSFPAIMSFTVTLACLPISHVMGQMGTGAVAAVSPPSPAEAATPPAVVQPPPPRFRTIHRQVSRLPLEREYRSRPLIDNADTAARERINAILERPMEPMDFNESPLRDVAEHLSEVLGVPVEIDARALEDLGLDLDTPITLMLHGVRGHALLNRMLSPLDLAWIVQDEALLITTKEKAEERLEVRLYYLPLGYDTDFQALIDLIQSTVAADTWDTVGGPGAMRPMEEGPTSQLVVSTTYQVHREVEGLLRGLHEHALAEFGGPEDPSGKTPTVRVHRVPDTKAREDLAAKLPELCNASLPANADPDARVSLVGESLVVQSRSPEFQALAAQLIRAVTGERVRDYMAELPSAPLQRAGFQQGAGFGPGGIGRDSFCWVARVVYGESNPRWLLFRSWLTEDAPHWLRDVYASHGEAFAAWIQHKPAGKALVRLLMDQAIALP